MESNGVKSDVKYPLLSGIEYPADLRRLTVDQLPQVCDELRSFIIDQLSVNPGHLASSLGVVELTVALHYVFNTPSDPGRSVLCVRQRCDLIRKNKEFMKNEK